MSGLPLWLLSFFLLVILYPVGSWGTDSAKILKGHISKINSLSWSPDGKYLASGGDDETLRIWDVSNVLEKRVFELFKTTKDPRFRVRVTSVAWSPAGDKLAVLTYDNRYDSVQIWDLNPDRGNKPLFMGLTSHPPWGSVKFSLGYFYHLSAAWSPDGRVLASAGWGDGRIELIEGQTGKIKTVLREPEMRSFSVAWSPDGKHLASGGWNDIVRIWDSNLKEQKVLPGIVKGLFPTRVAWSPDGRHLAASAYQWNEVRIWDSLTWSDQSVTSINPVEIAWSPDGKMLAVAEANGLVRLWYVSTGSLKRELSIKGSYNPKIAWSPDGRYLAAVNGMTILLWDLVQDSESHLRGKALVNAMAWSPDGQWLASASSDGIVRLWDVLTERTAFFTISMRQRIDQILELIKMVIGVLFFFFLVFCVWIPGFAYLLTAIPITVIIYFIGQRRRIGWLNQEYFFICLPLLLWVIFWFLKYPSGKLLGNYLEEPFLCGIPGGIILLPRLLVTADTKRKKLLIDLASAAIACIIVLVIIFLTPPIPADLP